MNPDEHPAPENEANSEKKASEGGITGRRNASRNAVDNFWTSLIPMPLQLLSSILVARALGPSTRGVFGFLLLFQAFAAPLMLVGFGSSVTYYVSSRRYKVCDIAFSSILVGIIHGLLATALVLTLWHFEFLGEVAKETPPWPVWAMAFLLPLQCGFNLTTRILLGDSRFALQNRLIMARDTLLAVLMISVVYVLKQGLEGAVMVAAIMSALNFSAGLFCIWALYRPSFRIHVKFLGEGYIYGLRAWFGNQAKQANTRLDHLLIAYFCKSEALGWYGVASKLTETLWALPNALSFVVFNKVAANRGKQQSAELIEKVHRPLIWLMLAISLLVGLASFWLIPLVFGEDYSPTALALVLLLPGTIAVTSSRIVGKYFAGKGRPEINGVSSLVGAAASLLLYPSFIFGFRHLAWFNNVSAGFLGAAIACSVVYGVIALTSIWFYRRMITPRVADLFRLHRDDIDWVVTQIRRGLGRDTAGKTATSPDIMEPSSGNRN